MSKKIVWTKPFDVFSIQRLLPFLNEIGLVRTGPNSDKTSKLKTEINNNKTANLTFISAVRPSPLASYQS